MNRGKLILGLAMAVLPTTTFAQSAGDGFNANGYIALAYLDFAGSDGEFAILGDVDLGMSFGAFGADLSVLSFETDDDGETKFFGGLSYTFGNEAKIVAGMPRSAFDRYGRFNIGDTSRFLGTILPATDESVLSSIVPILGDVDTPYGVRYDSRSDDSLKYSVSLQHVEEESVNVLGGSVEFVNGPTTYSGGLEYLTDGSNDASHLKLMVEQEFNVFTFGGAASYFSADGGLDISYLEGSMVWEPIDVVDVTGFVARTDSGFGSASMLYGVGGKYFFDRGANVGAAAVHGDGDTLYEFSVGLDF